MGYRGGSLVAAQSLAAVAGARCLENWMLYVGPGALATRYPRYPLQPRLGSPAARRDPAIPASALLTLAHQRSQHQAQHPVPRRPPRGRALGAHRARCHATHRQPGSRAGCPIPGAALASAMAPAAAPEPVRTTFLRLQPRSC